MKPTTFQRWFWPAALVFWGSILLLNVGQITRSLNGIGSFSWVNVAMGAYALGQTTYFFSCIHKALK